jgi:hypothetical protein
MIINRITDELYPLENFIEFEKIYRTLPLTITDGITHKH